MKGLDFALSIFEGQWARSSNAVTQLEISHLADDLGISHRHLNRCFREHYGVSIRDFIRYRRLQEARNLLQERSTDLSVTDTAYSCGFRHLGRFSAEYRQLFGKTPRQTLREANS